MTDRLTDDSAGRTIPHAGAHAAASPPRVGDYELLGEIARGGMGVVFRVW